MPAAELGTQAVAMEPTTAELIAQIDQLRAEIEALKSPVAAPDTSPQPSHTRRQAFRLAGAATAAAVVGSLASTRPAAAADPNDFVKNVNNVLTSRTGISGSIDGPLLEMVNTGTNGGALFGVCRSPDPAILGFNSGTGSGLEAAAVNGVDVSARGSGRVRLASHKFTTSNGYRAGELHQNDGTLFAMVTPTTRRVLAGPAAAGAFHLINPVRVYDSRKPLPSPGKLTSGSSRLIAVADARNLSTGTVVDEDVVPLGATGIAFNLTVTDTSNSGFLSIAPGSITSATASIINWSSTDVTLANASVIGVDGSRLVRVFCGAGSTHFLIDVMGYYL